MNNQTDFRTEHDIADDDIAAEREFYDSMHETEAEIEASGSTKRAF